MPRVGRSGDNRLVTCFDFSDLGFTLVFTCSKCDYFLQNQAHSNLSGPHASCSQQVLVFTQYSGYVRVGCYATAFKNGWCDSQIPMLNEFWTFPCFCSFSCVFSSSRVSHNLIKHNIGYGRT